MHRRSSKFVKAVRRRLKRSTATGRRLLQRHRRVVLIGAGLFLVGNLALALLPHSAHNRSPVNQVRLAQEAKRPPTAEIAAVRSRSEPGAAVEEISGSMVQAASHREPPSPEKPRPVIEAALTAPRTALPPANPPANPPWQRYAVAAPSAGGRPLVAIVIDDVGIDRPRSAEAMRLPAAVSLSFMTYANGVSEQAEAARRAGHELLMHVPMEAIDRRADPGPNGLFTTLSRDEIVARLRWDLGRFDGFIGINNHMGSKFTADERAMTPVIEELRARGLAFLDSRTSPASAGLRLAAAYGVPHVGRDVFLDDEISGPAIARQLAQVERVARQRGSAIAIGHPHDPTLAALSAWLPRLEGKGFVLVPVSAVLRHRMAQEVEETRQVAGDGR